MIKNLMAYHVEDSETSSETSLYYSLIYVKAELEKAALTQTAKFLEQAITKIESESNKLSETEDLDTIKEFLTSAFHADKEVLKVLMDQVDLQKSH